MERRQVKANTTTSEPVRRSAKHDGVTFDRDGVRWRVYEESGAVVPGARGSACLVFDSDAVIRRVWNYPTEWRALSAAELIAISWGT